MDWNRDGKVDKKDAWIYHNAIKPKMDSADKGDGSGGAPGGNTNKTSSSGSSFELTELGGVVLGLLFILVIALLCFGYASSIGSLLGFGIIVFMIAQWLDS